MESRALATKKDKRIPRFEDGDGADVGVIGSGDALPLIGLQGSSSGASMAA
jgi:hypothetical protein